MGKERKPVVGRPFSNEVTENQLKDLFQTAANVNSIETEWPLLQRTTPLGGIALRIDPDALQQVAGPVEPQIIPLIVRDVRDPNDHFVTVQEIDLTQTDPWDGLMRPVGEAFRAPVWAHHIARDFVPFVTRQAELDRPVPIVEGVIALGQLWVKQYLRWDLVQPRDRIRHTDCISAFVTGGGR